MDNRKTIYLDDAIDVAKQHWYKPDIAKALEKLPSAQLDLSGYSDRLWKRAYDRGYEQCRQDAIDALQKEIDNGIPPFNDAGIRCGVRFARNIIEDLPFEQPEVRKQMSSADCTSRQDALKNALDNITQDVIGEAGSVSGVYFGSKDFVWIEGSLYLPIERFKEATSKTNEESEASDTEAPSEDEDLGEWQPVLDYNPKYVDGNWEVSSEQSYYGGLPERLPMFKCSKCGTSYTVIGKGREQRELIYVTSRKTPHCPFCGKKMKVGEDNGND